jgi:hypothetical protein
MRERPPTEAYEMSFNLKVIQDDLQAIISQFNQAYAEHLSDKLIQYQDEAIEVLNDIKESGVIITNTVGFKAELSRKKDDGEISEPAYDLIIGIL